MKIPSDPVEAVIFGMNLALELLSLPADYAKLANGLAARAQAEGRDVTPDEEALLDAMLKASDRARDGGG